MIGTVLTRQLILGIVVCHGIFSVSAESMETTKLVLDELATMVGERHFDWTTWRRMQICMERQSSADLNLMDVSDAAWRGFVELGLDESIDLESGRHHYSEFNPVPLASAQGATFRGASDIVIAQPCNTLSNTAYYNTMISFCEMEAGLDWEVDPRWIQGLVRGAHGLAFGSFVAHAFGMSFPGRLLDSKAISMLGYTLHQAAVQRLPFDSVIHNLGEPHEHSLSLTRQFNEALMTSDAKDWESEFNALDIPHYEDTFAALALTYVNVIFDKESATRIGNHIITLLDHDDETSIRRYEAHIQRALEGVNPSFPARVDLLWKVVGVAVKMVYAFVWQEQDFGTSLDSSSTALRLGARFMPVVNQFANHLTKFGRGEWDDPRIQEAKNMYPGEDRCRRDQSHSKWHEQSANALVDMAMLSLHVDRVIEGGYGDGAGARPHLAAVVLAPSCAAQLAIGKASEPVRDAFSWIGNRLPIFDWMTPARKSASADEQMKGFTDCLVSSSPLFRCSKQCSLQRDSIVKCLGNCLLYIK